VPKVTKLCLKLRLCKWLHFFPDTVYMRLLLRNFVVNFNVKPGLHICFVIL